ncbi:hypothetical protein KB206_00380 [Microvirga sp. STS02]|uniref:hypothetical protein n=1 Tax=Hymenobacter negativus TaxID=2795026 RepID=UPI0018DCB70F|nr:MULTISPECIES: hypothetical protein [Bacteria]MBH8567321.1 hypothetical protein [Hymenobacter negativus]MBR7207053.1 hypothetical protein [Microvirga sp. STS02]
MKHLLLAFAILAGPAAFAQSVPATAYEFLTVAELQAQQDGLAKLQFAPAFQGKTEIQLERLPGTISAAKYMGAYRHNMEVVNQQLEAVTAAGWELVHVSSSPVMSGHEFLFRRPKK